MKPKTEIRCVLDASVLLAYLQREPGFERVRKALARGAAISTVNLAEVYAKIVDRGVALEETRDRLEVLGLMVFPFSERDARASATLYPRTRVLGLSLGDRACLALGQRLELSVLTADKAWRRLTGLSVELMR